MRNYFWLIYMVHRSGVGKLGLGARLGNGLFFQGLQTKNNFNIFLRAVTEDKKKNMQ